VQLLAHVVHLDVSEGRGVTLAALARGHLQQQQQ
jgi:hypothetical protein